MYFLCKFAQPENGDSSHATEPQSEAEKGGSAPILGAFPGILPGGKKDDPIPRW